MKRCFNVFSSVLLVMMSFPTSIFMTVPFQSAQDVFAPHAMVSPGGAHAEAIDMEKLFAYGRQIMLERERQHEFERSQLLERLSEVDCETLTQARAAYEAFLAELVIPTKFSQVVQDVLDECHMMEHLSDQDLVLKKQLDDALSLLLQGFKDHSFIAFLHDEHLAQQLSSAREQHGVLTLDVLNSIKHSLTSCTHLIPERYRAAISLLDELMGALISHDMKRFVITYMKHLRPFLDQANNALSVARESFDQRLDGLPFEDIQDQEKNDRKAYSFFLREVTNYARTIRTFTGIVQQAESFLGKTHVVFSFITYAFEFYRFMLSLYEKDVMTQGVPLGGASHSMLASTVWTYAPYIFDVALRGALAAWHFLLQSSDASITMLCKTLQGIQGLDGINPMMLLVSNALLSGSALFVFMNPRFWSYQHASTVKALGKVLSSWTYYHIVHCLLFDGPSHSNDRSFLTEGFTGIDTIWPRDYGYLRKACYGLIHETQKATCKGIHEQLRRSIGAEAMEHVETATLGIVKPELFGYVVETFLPLLLLDTRGFVQTCIHFKAEDVYDASFVRLLTSSPLGAQAHTKEELFEHYEEKYGASLHAYYIEYRILSYIFASVGSHMGKVVARNYQSFFPRLLGKCCDFLVLGCKKMGIMSDDMATLYQETKDDLYEGLMASFNIVGEFVKLVLSPGSELRTLIITLLEQRGDIHLNESGDDIDYQLVQFICRFFAERGMISYLEAYRLTDFFKNDPTQLDVFVQELASHIKQNIWTNVGSGIGQSLFSHIGFLVMRLHGPFWAKTSNDKKEKEEMAEEEK